MLRFKISVTQKVETKYVDHDDWNEFGHDTSIGDVVRTTYIRAADEDEALDKFHEEQPISLLENYEVEAKEVSNGCL
jgi:hypothetical protein